MATTAALAVMAISRGLVMAAVLTLLLGLVLAIFAGGYWYFVTRNHQADDPRSAEDTTGDYAEDERGSRA
jgi:hypothetical protein